MSAHAIEVGRGERFEFGENWSRFLAVLDDARIRKAEESLREMLEVDGLEGKSFLDIGSGSGLFSLAARRLGARVHSFDYDPRSVACARELRRRYFPEDDAWQIEEGSALDAGYVRSLGEFDVVYSWGVLHHTGSMWEALANAALPVARGGRLFVAIYNDLGSRSARWKWIKKTYNELPKLLRAPFAAAVSAPNEAKMILRAVATLKPGEYVRSWTTYAEKRGMSRWRDIVDWVGGYPYEYATPEGIFDFYRARGFRLTRMKCGGVGLGCNEFVFAKDG
ncbi:MAG TPA: class I SAM-dependent methyltransferase [Pyrinomonadaceae bacterium]|jgi:2-polyprenyl-6-hydroxyphenyl methylase/3-demethylubiquinone-9 3-methyltransferase|nr:class I SAM-dependent methyltransferase [Pyrinomonadaceae bacterium]